MSPVPQSSQPPIPTPGGSNNLSPLYTAVPTAASDPTATSSPSPTVPVFVPIVICVFAIVVIIGTICRCMSRNAQRRAQFQNQTCIFNVAPANTLDWVRLDGLEAPPPAYTAVGGSRRTTLGHHHWVGAHETGANAAAATAATLGATGGIGGGC